MRKHPRQEILKALDALLAEPSPEARPRADGWTALQPLWFEYLSEIGRQTQLREDEIEDLIQDVLLAILSRWKDYREPGGANRLLALSCKMMHDKGVDVIRRRDRHRPVPLEALPTEPATPGAGEGAGPADREEWHEYACARMDELKRHKEEYYELVYAHHVEGRSCEELAAEQGRSVHAIECAISRGLQMLRGFVAEHPPGGGPLP
jgi:DNA-directed RNA polymerase specialized sigma24 family protein